MKKHFFTTIRADAHCDIPCGIYDPTAAKVAARTVARMIDQIEELALPTDASDALALRAYLNSVTRRIRVKDEHAELCKKELEILWSDFFKPEHLKKFPNLHDRFWGAVKLASKCKQDPHKEDAVSLLATVDEIARAFYEAKGVPDRYRAYQEITDDLY